jgi:phosphohistidine swiveling domain-containing protein
MAAKKQYGSASAYWSSILNQKRKTRAEQNKSELSVGKSDKTLLEWILFLRQQSHLRLEYKDYKIPELKFLELFEEISKRIRISVDDYMKSYRILDTINFLKKGKKLSTKERGARKDQFIFFKDGTQKVFVSGREVDAFLKSIYKIKVLAHELRGISASSGVGTGRVRIILSENFESIERQMKEFKKGEVLVTTMTQPHLIVIMKRASAIVTDQGGITSHAAVISRELKIPCVIRTYEATRILKDGDLVEVDANKGIVKILERKGGKN